MKKPKPFKFELPDWIDPELWEAFEELRRKRKCDLIDYARKLIVVELEKAIPPYDTPNECLARTIRSGWLDVFPRTNEPPEKTGAWARKL